MRKFFLRAKAVARTAVVIRARAVAAVVRVPDRVKDRVVELAPDRVRVRDRVVELAQVRVLARVEDRAVGQAQARVRVVDQAAVPEEETGKDPSMIVPLKKH